MTNGVEKLSGKSICRHLFTFGMKNGGGSLVRHGVGGTRTENQTASDERRRCASLQMTKKMLNPGVTWAS